MPTRAAYYLVFWVLMTFLVAGAAVVVVFLYLPFVALKAVWMSVTGKATPKWAARPNEAAQQ